ncbi:MAG: hypothetical protein HY649_05340 [Acidobacteria bacterium]|nr:hypothetical protein [Acidobacteriota bacterium]
MIWLLACSSFSDVFDFVLEELPVRQKVLRQLEEHCTLSTTLATKTSGLSYTDTEVAPEARHPKRALGSQFFVA